MKDPLTLLSLSLGILLTVFNIVDRIVFYSKQAKVPEITQDNRIAKLELDVDSINKKLDSDNKRIIELEKSNRVMLKCMQALLSRDETKMDEEAAALNRYLLER